MKINLETRNKQDEILLKYLEENASESLAYKINNGITIEKDSKSLISKKDLKGFISYANDEAKKLAEKGATSAMVEDSVVFGWLMHYFEEDSIEGTLFNPDGKPYQPPKKTPTKTTTTPTIKKVEKKPEQQYSLFDMLTKNEEPVVKKVEEDDEIKTSSSLSFKGEIVKKSQPDPLFDEDTEDNEDDADIPSEEEIQEIMAQLHEEELAKNKVIEEPKPKISSFYLKYQDIQKQYPSAVIIYRLGDFYEVFGENAKTIANDLELTLTSRDCGLKERIPMVGFPSHCVEDYILKIHKVHDLVLVENENKIEYLPKEETKTVQESQKHWINDYTYVDNDGVMHEISKPSIEIPKFLLDVFANKITAR